MRNEYGYNDKELWEDGDVNWLDYGFRNYDPQIGRFLQIDPLSDDYAILSGYHYALNEPIANVDEDGLAGANAVAQIFTGAGAQAAADAARMAGNNLGEVVVKSTIKKAASKSLGKIILSKIAENSASLLGSLLNAGNDIVDKGKEIYNSVSLNIELEDARTGKSFFERFLERTIRLENIGLGGGGLGLAEEVLKLEIRYSTVAAGELKTGVSLTASGVGTADLYRVVGSGIVYSTSLEKSGGNSSGSSNTPIKYKKPKPNISRKEGAKDVPSWARGEKPIEGENGDRFARRLLDKKYGKGNYSSKSQTEYSKIQKWGDRAFE